MAASVAEIVFGIAGYAMSLLLFLAPGIMMCLNGVAQYNPLPHAVTAANCAIWLAYGIKKAIGHSQSAASASTIDKIINNGVPWVNGAGMALEFIYVVLFFIRSPADDHRRRPLKVASYGGGLAAILGGVLFFINDTLAGWYCALCGLAVYGVPMYDVLKVLLSRPARYLPPLLNGFASFLNGLAWCVFYWNPR